MGPGLQRDLLHRRLKTMNTSKEIIDSTHKYTERRIQMIRGVDELLENTPDHYTLEDRQRLWKLREMLYNDIIRLSKGLRELLIGNYGALQILTDDHKHANIEHNPEKELHDALDMDFFPLDFEHPPCNN